jgi:hypothetical protein
VPWKGGEVLVAPSEVLTQPQFTGEFKLYYQKFKNPNIDYICYRLFIYKETIIQKTKNQIGKRHQKIIKTILENE